MTEAGERTYTITKMCAWLEVSTSGYDEWRDRPESATAARRAYLTLMVRKAFEDSLRPTATDGSTPSWSAGPDLHRRARPQHQA
jgi:hypothetical protein